MDKLTPRDNALALIRLGLDNEYTKQILELDRERGHLLKLERLSPDPAQFGEVIELARQKLNEERHQLRASYNLAFDLLSNFVISAAT